MYPHIREEYRMLLSRQNGFQSLFRPYSGFELVLFQIRQPILNRLGSDFRAIGFDMKRALSKIIETQNLPTNEQLQAEASIN